jgi:hypothetical protein
VLGAEKPACPSCSSKDLEKIFSAFAVAHGGSDSGGVACSNNGGGCAPSGGGG